VRRPTVQVVEFRLAVGADLLCAKFRKGQWAGLWSVWD
jgi:hypothetical protein